MSEFAPAQRPRPRRTKSAAELGLPDPRPVTTYSVEVLDDHDVKIKLDQPCVVRAPMWKLVDSFTGEEQAPASVTVQGTTQFTLHYTGAIKGSMGFMAVPYMDTQVQNFAGGFVSPGGQWFRTAG